MIFGVPAILAYVTRWITLRPGDVVLTGSPAGVGPMVPGDRVTVEIGGLGSLSNPVALRR
jgi:2-keto-4-pentenoate hydratase/2-oxohepta-3-ene-1,7-dioic acid hydratase in catechol pathway